MNPYWTGAYSADSQVSNSKSLWSRLLCVEFPVTSFLLVPPTPHCALSGSLWPPSVLATQPHLAFLSVFVTLPLVPTAQMLPVTRALSGNSSHISQHPTYLFALKG